MAARHGAGPVSTDLAWQARDDLLLSRRYGRSDIWRLQAGDREAARTALRQSLSLRQRSGRVPHVLAQYLALAELAR